MTLIVEDGTGLPTAQSYASVAAAAAYCAANALAWPADVPTAEMALRRATLWIDTTYRGQFPGLRQNRQFTQALEWPRVGAYVVENADTGPSPADFGFYDTRYPYATLDQFDYIAPSTLPPQLVNATIEAAAREVASPGLLMGDVAVTPQLKKEAAGDTSFEYFQNPSLASATSGNVRFPVIDAILYAILIQRSGLTARAARR